MKSSFRTPRPSIAPKKPNNWTKVINDGSRKIEGCLSCGWKQVTNSTAEGSLRKILVECFHFYAAKNRSANDRPYVVQSNEGASMTRRRSETPF